MLVNKIICKMYKSIGNSLISCIFRCKISKNCWNCAVMEQLVTTKCHEWNSKTVRYPRGTLPGIGHIRDGFQCGSSKCQS